MFSGRLISLGSVILAVPAMSGREGKCARLGKSAQFFAIHPLLSDNNVMDAIIVCPLSIRASQYPVFSRNGSFHTLVALWLLKGKIATHVNHR
jgi:hypothetical protein